MAGENVDTEGIDDELVVVSGDDDVNDDTSGGEQDDVDGTGDASVEELQLARDNGWTPRGEWKGDPDKWVDAKQFADRAKGINGLLQRRLSEQESTIQQLRSDVAELLELRRTGETNEIDAQITDAEAARVEAISAADGAGAVAAERKLNELRARKEKLEKRPAPAKTEQPSAEDRDFSAQWLERNPWMRSENRVSVLAVTVGQRLRTARPDLVGNVPAFLTELEKQMRKDYPELMDKQMRAARTETQGNPSRTDRRTVKQSYENMPKDAQAACDRLVDRKVIKKREDYVKQYFAAYPNG